ncbi:recombinase family protein [Streptomyces rhizosphaericus]|uniref:Recombinase family protein n=1 Tax=Streptomyces rhizosphaericus TaxID=114699 RepID=A0A6G4AEU1_9ACTN|nr:recombinase family protein [Streptomyces rhizosphaericus]NEW71007.1 recombinase family protein [Streptomyces rhizosphaericus]
MRLVGYIRVSTGRQLVQEAILAQIRKHGGRAFTANSGGVHPDDPMRTAMRQMRGVFAQLERSVIAARLRHGRREKAEQGGYAYGARRTDGGLTRRS